MLLNLIPEKYIPGEAHGKLFISFEFGLAWLIHTFIYFYREIVVKEQLIMRRIHWTIKAKSHPLCTLLYNVQCSYSLLLTSSLFIYSRFRFPNRFVQKNPCYPLLKYVICSNRSKEEICSFAPLLLIFLFISCMEPWVLYTYTVYTVHCTWNVPS